MARVFEVGTHLLAVVDPSDVFAGQKRLVVARLITRDGTKYNELMDVVKCAGLLKHLRQHGADFFSDPCEALPLGTGPQCSDIAAVRVWTKQLVTQLGNGGFACYLPNGRILWSRWGTLVRSLRRDLALHPHEPLTPSEFALLIGDELDGRIVAQWLSGERISADHYEVQFLWLRILVDAMRFRWVLAHRHPAAWKFVRGKLPGKDAFVLEFLKTDEGAAQVMKYIAETADPEFLRDQRIQRTH